mmetsp:Transcript_20066/g.40495  ORF Transcript_20066/g.40495 Transcript_20066/m.40495 type:complete len:367 (-) Transcript_20066:309-1409(-)
MARAEEWREEQASYPLPPALVMEVMSYFEVVELLRALGMWNIYGIPRPYLNFWIDSDPLSGVSLAQLIAAPRAPAKSRPPLSRYFSELAVRLSSSDSIRNIDLLSKCFETSRNSEKHFEAAKIYVNLERTNPLHYRYKFPDIAPGVLRSLLRHKVAQQSTAFRLVMLRVIFDNEGNRRKLADFAAVDGYVDLLNQLTKDGDTTLVNHALALLTTLTRPFCICDGESTNRLSENQNLLLNYLATKQELNEALERICTDIHLKPTSVQHHVMWLLVNVSINNAGACFVTDTLMPWFMHLKWITPVTGKRLLMLASNICYHSLDRPANVRRCLRHIIALCTKHPMDAVASKCYGNVLGSVGLHVAGGTR